MTIGSVYQNGSDTVNVGSLTNNGSINIFGYSGAGTGVVVTAGTLTNAGSLNTEAGDTLTVTGAVNNEAGASLSDGGAASMSTLTNGGSLSIGNGATLTLTNQANGITDVVAGSSLSVGGTFDAGANSALYKLNSVEGSLTLQNGATTAATPGSGTLTVARFGSLSVNSGASAGTTLSVNGNLSNSGALNVAYVYDHSGFGNTLTVTGALTNQSTGTMTVGSMFGGGSVLTAGTLTNTGSLSIFNGDTLNLTAQANGITDVVAGSTLTVAGTFDAGANSALYKLNSIEGALTLENEQTTNMTPGSGTLTVASTGSLYLYGATPTTLKVTGGIANSGILEEYGGNTLAVTGGFTNQAGADFVVGEGSGGAAASNDVASMPTLTNSGRLFIGQGAMLTLTNQANGITDVVAGSSLLVGGTFNAGANNGLYKLNSVEGLLILDNGATTSATPGSGILTVASGGAVIVGGSPEAPENAAGRGAPNAGTTLTVNGSLNNSGSLYAGYYDYVANTLTVSGVLTNQTGGYMSIGSSYAFSGNADTVDVATLTNNGSISVLGYSGAGSGSVLTTGTLTNTGSLSIGSGDTLNLTASGTSTNSTNIGLNGGTLEISGASVTLAGAGTITLSTSANSAAITGNGAGVVLTSANTIEGTGTISGLGIVNTGTILANQSTPLTILPSAAGLTNNGTLSVLTGDTMQIGTSSGGALTNYANNTLTGGTYTVGGTLEFGASGTSIVTDAANISLTGAGAEIVDFASQNVLKNLQTITGAGSLTMGAKYGTFTTTGNFANNGTLTVGTGDKFIVDLSDSLTNFSGSTLTGGTYKISGTLEFNGANIVTNDANITLTGAASKIEGKSAANGLANFAVNNGSFTLGSKRSFTTAGGFTNNGSLTVGAGDTFDVTGSLSNLAGGTLTGGTYNVSGTLAVAGDIATNAANITLASSSASFGALAGFNTNAAAGKFTLSGDANFSTTGGSFTNAGLFTVSTGSTFTVGGSGFNFTQTGGTTTVDGTLTNGGSGSLNLNGGSLYGTGTLDYGVVDTATVTPGNSSTSTGKLGVDGTYAQSLGGALDVTIGGKTAGTQYDQLNVTGTASLDGTLNITLAAGYTPKVGNTFDILNASSISGAFTTINGLAINSKESFEVTEVGNDEIVLTVVKGAAQTDSGTLTQSLRAGLVHGRYGRELYTQGPLAVVGAPAIAAGVAPGSLLALKPFRPRDDFGSSATAAPMAEGGSALGMSPVSAAAYNSMAAMNHMRFECGVDVKALLQTSPKRLLRALWAAPDSKEALDIGYMNLTTTH
jgi:hypothetical protein